jgi:hypothetical protein
MDFVAGISSQGDLDYEVVPRGANSPFTSRVQLLDSTVDPILVQLQSSIVLLETNKYGQILHLTPILGLFSNQEGIQRLTVVSVPGRQTPNITLNRLTHLVELHFPFSSYYSFLYSIFYRNGQPFRVINNQLVDPRNNQVLPETNERFVELLSTIPLESPALVVRPGRVLLYDMRTGEARDTQAYPDGNPAVYPLTSNPANVEYFSNFYFPDLPVMLDSQSTRQTTMPRSSRMENLSAASERPVSVSRFRQARGPVPNRPVVEGPPIRSAVVEFYQPVRFKPTPIVNEKQVGDYFRISHEQYQELEPLIVRVDTSPGFSGPAGTYVVLLDGRKFFLPS